MEKDELLLFKLLKGKYWDEKPVPIEDRIFENGNWSDVVLVGTPKEQK